MHGRCSIHQSFLIKREKLDDDDDDDVDVDVVCAHAAATTGFIIMHILLVMWWFFIFSPIHSWDDIVNSLVVCTVSFLSMILDYELIRKYYVDRNLCNMCVSYLDFIFQQCIQLKNIPNRLRNCLKNNKKEF